MRTLVATFGRHIAAFVMLAMLTSGIAMAAYVCPKAPAGLADMTMSPHTQGMDEQMPAHCAERHAGDKQALEQSGSPPVPALPQVVSVQLVPPAAASACHALSTRSATPVRSAHAPPFLRTLRLRI